MTAIDCWITGCTWWKNEPPGVHYTSVDRDSVRVRHMISKHTAVELTDEIAQRMAELRRDHHQLSTEQLEDRNAILRVLHHILPGMLR